MEKYKIVFSNHPGKINAYECQTPGTSTYQNASTSNRFTTPIPITLGISNNARKRELYKTQQAAKRKLKAQQKNQSKQ